MAAGPIRQTIDSCMTRRYDPDAYRRLRMNRAAIYVRVSTDKQTIENQLRELRQIAERRGWEVVHEYHDAGISGAKSREARPGLDQMLKDAQRRRFDVVMAWAIDRLGRSLIDLLGTIQTLEGCGDVANRALSRNGRMDPIVVSNATPARERLPTHC
jgi:predicted site-specific integrase-resolvase